MTPERWAAEQQFAGRFLQDFETTSDAPERLRYRGLYIQKSEHGRLLGEYRLRVEYPPVFPRRMSQPVVYLENPPANWVRTVDGHVLKGWRLCLGVALDREIDFTLTDSAVKLFELIDTFLRLERIYQRNLKIASIRGVQAKWPGPERSHGLLGLYESMREHGEPGRNEPCPCGSGWKFKKCHWADIEHDKERLRRDFEANQREAEIAAKVGLR